MLLRATFSVRLSSFYFVLFSLGLVAILTIWFSTPRFYGFYCTILIGLFIWFAPTLGIRGICIKAFCLQDVLKWFSEDISIVYWEWDLWLSWNRFLDLRLQSVVSLFWTFHQKFRNIESEISLYEIKNIINFALVHC